MPFTIITPPTVSPVTIDEVKDHCIIEYDDDDILIQQYINASTEYAQNLTGRQFVEATIELDLDKFPVGKILLRPNLQDVTSVKYFDSDDVEQTLDTSKYTIKKTTLVGYIEPVDEWPSDVADPAKIKIRFTSGYPLNSNVATTPEDIKIWLMVRVSGFYEQRENFVLSKGGRFGVAAMPRDFIDSVLDAYIVPGIGSAI